MTSNVCKPTNIKVSSNIIPEYHQYHTQHRYLQLQQFLQELYWIFHTQIAHLLCRICIHLLLYISENIKQKSKRLLYNSARKEIDNFVEGILYFADLEFCFFYQHYLCAADLNETLPFSKKQKTKRNWQLKTPFSDKGLACISSFIKKLKFHKVIIPKGLIS